MSDTEAAPPAAKSPAKTKSSKKKKNKKGPTSHPKYNKMIAETIAALKERGGSSRQAILKYILLNYDVGKDEKTVNNHLKMSLRAGIKNGKLYQSKGTGASGSFKLGDKAKVSKKKASKQAAEKSTPKPAAKATKAKKVKKPEAVKTKKDVKPKSPKKAKSPKKVKKSPKKAAARAKTAKKAKSKAKKPEVVIEVKEEIKEEAE